MSIEYARYAALERVGRDAKQYWGSLREEWKTDKEFILKALVNSSNLPPKSDFERLFPQSLRFDRDVVLAFTRREDFAELFEERHLFCPGILTGDKEVMLAYCRQIPRSLQECSEDLIDDDDIVSAAISRGGLELQYASLRLQADPEMVRIACKSDGRALAYCPFGQTREEMTSDKTFMKEVVLSKPDTGGMWKLLPVELKSDPDLLVQALKNGLSLRDVPHPYKQDSHFLQSAMGVNAQLYLQLHPSLQWNLPLAREAIISPGSTPDIHAKALEHCPSLKSEREIVLTICKRGDLTLLQELLSTQSLSRFVDDIEIMVAAVARDSDLISLASARLRNAPELILASITPDSAYPTLKTLSSVLLRDHPEIPTRAVEVCSATYLRHLPPYIPDEIWANHRPICRIWLERGGRVLQAFRPLLTVQPPYSQDDIELPLLVARYNSRELFHVGNALLCDRTFVVQALELEGRVLRYVAPQLQSQTHLQILAIANHKKNIPSESHDQHCIKSDFGSCIDIPKITQYVEEKLDLHRTFCQHFLRGIAIARPHQPPQLRSQLPMLDRGVETSEAFKKLVAEYLGVPLGKDLTYLRRAHANLVEDATIPANNVEPRSSNSNRRMEAAAHARRLMAPEQAMARRVHALHDARRQREDMLRHRQIPFRMRARRAQQRAMVNAGPRPPRLPPPPPPLPPQQVDPRPFDQAIDARIAALFEDPGDPLADANDDFAELLMIEPDLAEEAGLVDRVFRPRFPLYDEDL